MLKNIEKYTISYTIKSPSRDRKSFSIIEVKSYYQEKKRVRENKTLDDARIKAINNEFHKKRIDYNEALIRIESIKSKLTAPTINYTIPEANKSLLKRYLSHYRMKRNSKSQTLEQVEYSLKRLLKLCGQDKFEDLEAEEIYILIESSEFKISGKNRLLITANMLFKYLGRVDDIFGKRFEAGKHIINYISQEELQKYNSKVLDLKSFNKSDRKNKEVELITMAYVNFYFYTGLRPGEQQGLKDSDFFDNYILIVKQLTRKQLETETKNAKNRAVLLLPGVRENWEIIKKNKFSHNEVSRRIKSSILKHIGRDISAGDLRHSFAMFLRSKKFDIGDIAQSLGNRIDVCMRFYAGFSLHQNKIDDLIIKAVS